MDGFLIVSNISKNRVFNVKYKKYKSDERYNKMQKKVDHAGVGFKLAWSIQFIKQIMTYGNWLSNWAWTKDITFDERYV